MRALLVAVLFNVAGACGTDEAPREPVVCDCFRHAGKPETGCVAFRVVSHAPIDCCGLGSPLACPADAGVAPHNN